MYGFKIFYIAGIFLLSFNISSCQPDASLPEDVINSIEKRIENGVNPGIAIGMVDAKGTSFFNFGKTSANGRSVDEHTIYEIGSITKVFTAILLAELVLDGAASLNDPISKYLPPDVQVPYMGSTQITLGHLSDHTSGFPRMPTYFAPANPNNPFADYTVGKMYTFIKTYEPTREPGSEYEYSNLAQGLLGHILALNAGLGYEYLMINKIAMPLGMDETKIELDDRMKDNLAKGHSGGAEVENWDIPSLAGAGAIRSSASDMLKFLSANLGFTETPLKDAMELTHAVRHDKAGNMRVGLGWHIKKGASGDVIWHNGGTGGYRAFIGFVKESGKGVVVLSNSDISVDDIGFHLLDPDSKLTEIQSRPEEIKVPEEVLEKYVGDYEMKPDFHVIITREGSQLSGQATGQQKFELFAKKENEFFLKVVAATITFQVEEGKIKSLTLFQNGQEVTGKKIK